MRKYRNQIFVGLGMALLIYIGLLLLLDTQDGLSEGVWQQIQQFPLEMMLLAILAQIGVIFFRFIEWQYYLGVIEARDKLSVWDSLIIFVTGFTFVVSPAKVAEVLKSVFLKVKTDVPIARSAPIIVAERVVDGIAVILTLVVTLILAGDRLELGEYEARSQYIIFTSAGILAIGLIVVQIAPLAYFCLRILERMPIVKRFHGALLEFYESSREIFHLKHVIPMSIVGVGVYTSSALGFLFVLTGLGLDMTWELFLQAVFIAGIVSAISALSFVPNGAGIAEVSNAGLLMAVVAPVNPIMTTVIAATGGLIQGFFHNWLRVLVGIVVGFVFRKRLLTGNLEEAIAELETTSHEGQTVQIGVQS